MRRNSRLIALAGGIVLAAALVPGSAAADGGHDKGDDDDRLLSSTVAGSLIDDPDLFGARPGGAPWIVDEGEIRLDSNGRLRVEVEGLIIPTTGVNPVPGLAASVICNGEVVATTKTVPFSMDGDAKIRAHVKLPDRCLAPAVLLNPNGNTAVYIGASGMED